MITIPSIDVDTEFAGMVDELTRRGFLGGIAGSAALLGLTACGSDGSPGSPSSAAPTTRTVSTAYGPVQVPIAPSRVIALSKNAIATLLDVGVTPVGVDDDEADIQLPKYQKTVAALPTVGSYGQFNIEAIAALRPDLIVSYDTYLDKTLYPKVAAIAPTVAIKTNAGNIAWQDATAAFAGAVNRGDRLGALQKQYDDKLASLGATYGPQLRGNTWEITQNADKGTFYRYLPSSDGSVMLAKMGATLGNASATGADDWGPQHSYETIEQQLGKATVILCVERGSEPLLAQQPWQALPAAKAGHVYTTDLLFPAGYAGAMALLDVIAGICAKFGSAQ